MKPIGRRWVALFGLLGTMALLPGVTAAGVADTTRSEIELTSKDVDSKEATLADLVTDAMRAFGKADIALVTASSFKEATLPKGVVSAADVLKAVECKGDNVVLVKLTGDQIMRALEHGLYRLPDANQGFLQVSGLTVTINPDAERGKRVVGVKVDDEKLAAGKTYKVAMPEPLANGALAYFKFWKKEDIDKDTGKTVQDAVTAYLNAHKVLPKGDERLVIKGK